MLAKDFYLIIRSDESTTHFVINIFLVNNENAKCNKCGSEMNLHVIRKERTMNDFYIANERDIKLSNNSSNFFFVD